jgi:small subunit ribosomal protein S11
MGKKRIIKKGGEEMPETIGSHPEGTFFSPARGTSVERGIAFILATYNNTRITVTDERGNALAWSSAGALGFSGAKKATPFAAARVAEVVAEKAKKRGVGKVNVRVSGVGSGRDSAIRSLANHGIEILGIKDTTPLPHNGPRPKKVRRV